MPDEEKIEALPKPEESGTDATQEKAIEVISEPAMRGIPPGSITQYPLTSALRAISEIGIKGQSAMVLLAAGTARLESDLADERNDRKKASQEADRWKDKFHEESQTNAVLREKLKSYEHAKRPQNVLLTLGGIVTGIAVPNLLKDVTGSWIALTLLGACLLLIGWILPRTVRKEENL